MAVVMEADAATIMRKGRSTIAVVTIRRKAKSIIAVMARGMANAITARVKNTIAIARKTKTNKIWKT